MRANCSPSILNPSPMEVFRLGIDAKGVDVPAGQIAAIVRIGLIVVALPLYFAQRSVPLRPAMTIAA